MWESTVEVTREAVVEAAPEHAWSLVSDSAAWSLRPGRFAFDVPQVTEAGRLRCWFAPFGKGLGCSVQEVREEVPGQVMSVLSRSTQPAGRQAVTLSVQPHDRGATVGLTVSVTGPREDKPDYKAFWRTELKAWLSALADVAEGRRPWPEAGIPAPIRRACAGLPALTSPQGTSTAVSPGICRHDHQPDGGHPPGPAPGWPGRKLESADAAPVPGDAGKPVALVRRRPDHRSALRLARLPVAFSPVPGSCPARAHPGHQEGLNPKSARTRIRPQCALSWAKSGYNHLMCLALTNGIRRSRVEEVLDPVGLRKVARKRSGGFSLGMGQRLGIAAAMLGDPRVLMFDEPVNGLDPEGVLWIRNLLKSLAAEGRTVFLSSHL